MAGAPPAGGCVPPCPPAPEDGLRVGPQPAAAPAVSTASTNTATARADMGASFPRTSSCPVPTALASRPAEPPSQRSQIHHGPTPHDDNDPPVHRQHLHDQHDFSLVTHGFAAGLYRFKRAETRICARLPRPHGGRAGAFRNGWRSVV